jgi:hypothetical protein
MMLYKKGKKTLNGNSEKILAQKYALVKYILLLFSLKNTALSAGNNNEVLLAPEKPSYKLLKKRSPFLF